MTQNRYLVSATTYRRRSRGFRALLLPIGMFLLPQSVNAANLEGLWATNVEACKELFVKKGNATYLASDADLHGSGFVVSGNIIRGKIATCKITSTEEDGKTVHLRTTCATDISVSSNQFDLKILDNDKIVRSIPGIPEMDTPYFRCPSNN